MRSTHACTPSFATLSSQYSRRLLSILAQQKRIKFINNKVVICLWRYFKLDHRARSSILTTKLSNDFSLSVLQSSQRNVDHAFIRFAWMCFVNKRHNIFRLTFFSQRNSSSLRKEMLIMLSCASRVR